VVTVPRVDPNLLGSALEGLCIGLVTMNAAGRIAWMNRVAQRTLGLDGEECRGRAFANVIKDPQMAAFWQEAVATEDTALGEVSLRWPRAAELKVNATTSLDPSGKLIGRALVFCDVSDERSIQVKLSQEATERLLKMAAPAEDPAGAKAALTPRELDVLRHVGSGLGNQQIAEAMSVSPSTVRTHLKHIYKKLGLPSRSDAICYALRNNLA
jgi:DNA-binding CsgD family transcriptional regulator